MERVRPSFHATIIPPGGDAAATLVVAGQVGIAQGVRRWDGAFAGLVRAGAGVDGPVDQQQVQLCDVWGRRDGV